MYRAQDSVYTIIAFLNSFHEMLNCVIFCTELSKTFENWPRITSVGENCDMRANLELGHLL